MEVCNWKTDAAHAEKSHTTLPGFSYKMPKSLGSLVLEQAGSGSLLESRVLPIGSLLGAMPILAVFGPLHRMNLLRFDIVPASAGKSWKRIS